jgi:hypothetical protein
MALSIKFRIDILSDNIGTVFFYMAIRKLHLIEASIKNGIRVALSDRVPVKISLASYDFA